MKSKLIQLEILNNTIRTCLATYDATRDLKLLEVYEKSGDIKDLDAYNKSGDMKYIEAANLSQEKFVRISASIDPDSDLTVMRISQ